MHWNFSFYNDWNDKSSFPDAKIWNDKSSFPDAKIWIVKVFWTTSITPFAS